MELVEEKDVRFNLVLDDKKLIKALFSMTPYYYRTNEADMKKLESLERLETSVDVKIKIFCKR
jgi:23S rRNA (guanine745-N1)-methyltransferase